jgi:hypothetical protein
MGSPCEKSEKGLPDPHHAEQAGRAIGSGLRKETENESD